MASLVTPMTGEVPEHRKSKRVSLGGLRGEVETHISHLPNREESIDFIGQNLNPRQCGELLEKPGKNTLA